jgi:hypothetical protein
MCSFKLAIYATTRAQKHTPKRVLNDPREKGSSGKNNRGAAGASLPVHAAKRLDAGHVAMLQRNVNRLLLSIVIFDQGFSSARIMNRMVNSRLRTSM